MKKIFTYANLNKIKEEIKGKKVLVGGCFDILHIGHLRFLKEAKKAGNFLIIALESDEFIVKKKNKKPFHNQDERAEILASLEFTDIIIKLPFFKTDKEYFDLVQRVAPDIIALTRGDPQANNKIKQARRVGGKVLVVTDYINDKASSLIDRLNILSYA